MNKIRDFTDLIAWQEGHRLVLLVYDYTKRYPRYEIYSLVDQMKRASISITSNIAEGFGRQTYKEKIQFYYTAQGSLTELKNQIIISRDVDFLTNEQYALMLKQLQITHQLLQGLITKSKSFLNPES